MFQKKKITLRTGKHRNQRNGFFFPDVVFLEYAETGPIVLLLRVYLEPRNEQLHKTNERRLESKWMVNT